MKSPLLFGGFALGLLVMFSADSATVLSQERGSAAVDNQRALVDEYCVKCHNDRLKSGGFSWTVLNVAHPESNAQQAEKVIRKLQSGMMPPSGQPRPTPA